MRGSVPIWSRSDFDHLFRDGEHFRIGELDAEVLYTPGHTPADISYKIADTVFVGDTMFMPDYGTARADFPGGDAHQLYRSISDYWHSLPRPGCSCVTIIRPPAERHMRGRPLLGSNAKRTFT